MIDARKALKLLFAGTGSAAVAEKLGVGKAELERTLLALAKESPPAVAEPIASPAGETLSIRVDAGSRGNPGPSAYAFVVENGIEPGVHGDFLGHATNNEAEYRGLIAALEWLSLRKEKSAAVYMDSLLVVNQVNGKWKIKEPRLMKLAIEARMLMNDTAAILSAVPREENAAADAEVNRILDEAES